MFECINLLITKHSFSFQSWEDRYGKGIWACLSPDEYLLDEIREYTSDGDVDMILASDYIEATNWLPFVTGKDFIEALNNLEKLLASLPRDMLNINSIWSINTGEALRNLQEMRKNKTFHHYPALPATFNELISSC